MDPFDNDVHEADSAHYGNGNGYDQLAHDDDPFGAPVAAPAASTPQYGSDDYGMGAVQSSQSSFTNEDAGDDSKYREYERQLQEEISQKDNSEYDAINDMRTNARDTLDKIFEERRQRIEQKHKNNSEAEANSKSENEGLFKGNPWAGAVSLVNIQSKSEGRDINRMKAILIKQKNTAA